MAKTTIVRLVSTHQLETAVSNVFDAIRKLIVDRQQEILRSCVERDQDGAPSSAPYLEDLPPECRPRLLELAALAEQISKVGYFEFGQHLELMTLFRVRTSAAPDASKEAK